MIRFKRGNLYYSLARKRGRHFYGFTVLEALIVVAIMAIISAVGLSFNLNTRSQNLLSNTVNEISDFLKLAQQKSVSQEGGYSWGVHFENPTNGPDFYALYYGSSYSTSTQTEIYYLKEGVIFINPTSSQSLDVLFNKVRGDISSGTQQIILGLNNSSLLKTITVCSSGAILRDSSSCSL